MLRLAVLLAALCLCAASAQPQYSVRRAALAPELAPSLRDGQPMAQRAEVAVGSAGLVELAAPEAGSSGDPGVEVPRYDVNGALRLRASSAIDVGLVWDQGLDDGARPLAEDQPAVDGGDVMGGGLSFGFHGETGVPGLYISVNLDLLGYSVPYVEQRTCVELCDDVPTDEVYRGRKRIGVAGLGLVGSWRSGPWTLFGGFAARNHPRVPKGGIEYGPDDGDHEVSAGPFQVLVSGGAAYTLPHDVRVMAMVYQTVTDDTVRYAPTMAVGITVPFGGNAPPPPPGRAVLEAASR
jgi:hypothetical protein